MKLIPEFYCAYVDYKSAPMAELSRLLQTLESDNVEAGPSEAHLATCQRFEVYTFNEQLQFPFSLFGALAAHVTIISGVQNVLRRLTAIAAGTESLLLGERFIPQQVKRAFDHVPHDAKLFELCKKAVLIAHHVTDQYKFLAPVDYAEIGYELLRTRDNSNGKEALGLLIIGSGMLGRALAEHRCTADYEKVYAVSRWPKQLRKKLKTKSAVCIHPENAPSMIANMPFDMLIAVSNVSSDYIAYLQDLIQHPHCRAAVDMSTTPIFPHERPSYYIHEYDADFTKHLLTLSAPLRAMLPEVNHALDTLVQQEVRASAI